MAKESIILELNAESDWNGNSDTALSRDNALVTGQRVYKFNISGPHGRLPADLGGLFSPVSAKLVGVAYPSWSPESKARVVANDAAGTVRQEITLKPVMQYVALHPGDRLSLLTRDGGRGPVVLSVNEMNEQDAVTWGLRHEPFVTPTRLRIIRSTGAAFVPDLGTLWQPTFAYDAVTGIVTATDNGIGVITIGALGLYPRGQGCYVSIRYARSSGDGKLHLVDNLTRASWAAQTAMVDVQWSKVQFVSHDDGIALDATPAVVGSIMTCDLEVTPVHPGNRLCGRYEGGL
jgi:hypothetical protein